MPLDSSPRYRRWRVPVIVLGTVLIALVAARWPVTTAVGTNFQVSVKRITLFEKAVAFVDRDLEMRRLTKEIAGAGGSPEQRLMRMYQWVADNIHPVPPGLPIMDDHVLNIFVRRYGELDQRAEALAALASYDGMPGARLPFERDPRHRALQLTVVKLGERLLMFDVNNRIAFHRASGDLATLKDLQADPSLITLNAAGLTVNGIPYGEYFAGLQSANPSFVRMEKQRFWWRLKDELVEHLVGS